ncbi:MAG: hypothetical protein ACM3UL_00250 [Ignavibacteria bacterium]
MNLYQMNWNEIAAFHYAILRPELPSAITLDVGLKVLYEDCYQTLLIGRYNASIVMMGVFLESLMKERIRLKTGKDFVQPYGACIDKLRGIKRLPKGKTKRLEHGYLVEPKDIVFLERFRDKIRNTFTHFDQAKLVEGRVLRGWEIPFDILINKEKFEELMSEVKSGKRKPMLLNATHPALRSVSKVDSDRMMAIRLFNIVYDYLLGFASKYLRSQDYDEYHKKFPNPFTDLSPIAKK